jgi:hypothetical protein
VRIWRERGSCLLVRACTLECVCVEIGGGGLQELSERKRGSRGRYEFERAREKGGASPSAVGGLWMETSGGERLHFNIPAPRWHGPKLLGQPPR